LRRNQLRKKKKEKEREEGSLASERVRLSLKERESL
jgi:hypothetical protein